MSTAKQESDPYPIEHGDNLKLSQTKLLCHIHDGLKTCSHCEPGLMSAVAATTPPYDIEATDDCVATNPVTTITSSGATLTHKEGVKRLKKRYGLEEDSTFALII